MRPARAAVIEAALSYAARGWRVHPLHHVVYGPDGAAVGCSCGGKTMSNGVLTDNGCIEPDSRQWGKHPRGPWRQRTTADPAAIREMWGRFKDAGVGIACGPGSDLWVLDVDGAEGMRQLADLEARHGQIGDTWTVQTGSGGAQLYFRWPLDGRKPTNRSKLEKSGMNGAGQGIDARGDGGQVVAPPSANRNGGYSVINNADPVYAPGWLLDLVCPPAAPPRAPSSHPAPAVSGEGIEKRLRAYLAKVCNEVSQTTAGGQNALNKAAWGIGRKAAAHPGVLSDAEVYDALYAAAMAAGLPSGSTATTLRSTLAKAAANPEPLAERERPVVAPHRAPKTARPAPAATGTGADSPEAEDDAGEAPTGAGEGIDDAPPPPAAAGIAGLPEGWVTPPGWLLSSSGVWREEKEGATRIAAGPIWIASRRRDVDTGAVFLEIAWNGGSAMVAREDALNRQKLVSLAGQDAPVSSESARGIVRWLEAAEAANRATLPEAKTIGRMGWVKGDTGPVWQGPLGPYHLRAEQGERQVSAAMRPHGDSANWRALAAEVHAVSPVALAVLAASVGSVMLARIGGMAAPFVIDLSGGSGRGKTVAMRWAASAWADPRDGAAWIKPWTSTPPAVESFAAFLQNAPLMLDDTRKLNRRRREELGGVVYQWASGQGAGRGRIDGAREVRTWRSVILSTGEVPLPSVFGQDIGLRMRMVRIEDDPFPPEHPLVNQIEDIAHWGHAGAEVAAWAAATGDAELRKIWTGWRAWFLAELGGGNWANRVSGYAATIWLGMMALDGSGVPIVQTTTDMQHHLLRWLRAGIESADVPSQAWDRLQAWIVSQAGRIVHHPGPEARPDPAGGWLGRSVAVDGQSVLALRPDAVDAELRRWGYDPDDIYPAWRRTGRLIPEPDGADGKAGRHARQIRWLGQKTRLYHLATDPDAAAATPIADPPEVYN